jgi:hypothetical protein
MRSRLLAFSGFADDPRSVLAAVHRLASMRVELLLDGGLGIPHVGVTRELGVAAFADSEHWDVPDSFYDPKIALCHRESLAHSAGKA